jgi:hypothetical protein
LVFIVISFLPDFPLTTFMCSSSPHSFHMLYPTYPPRRDHSNYPWCRVQVMKLHVMQSFQTACHFVSLRSKYSPQHPILKYPWCMLIPQRQRPSSTPIQNRSQNVILVRS